MRLAHPARTRPYAVRQGTSSTTFHSTEHLGYHEVQVQSSIETTQQPRIAKMMRMQRCGLLALSMMSWLLLSHPVRAQSAQETAMARALFEEGVAAADQENWPEAVDRFRRAHAIKPTPGITFNLASALTEAGQVIEAGELLENLCRDPKTPPDLLRECETKREQAASKRAFLTLEVEPGAPAEAQVEIDGHPWPRAVWGVASPINPGAHSVLGLLQGEEVARSELELSPGERRGLRLSFPVAASAVPETATEPEAAPVQERRDPKHERERKPLRKNWMLWAGVSAVVVGGVVLAAVLAGGDSTTQAPVPGNAGVITW